MMPLCEKQNGFDVNKFLLLKKQLWYSKKHYLMPWILTELPHNSKQTLIIVSEPTVSSLETPSFWTYRILS